MAALITLAAVPGHIEQHAGYNAKVVEICGREIARTTTPVATVGDVREAVRAFGTAIRARDPQSSFAILVGVRRGDRKPGGFDAAQRGDGFGQDDFLRVRDEAPRASRRIGGSSRPRAGPAGDGDGVGEGGAMAFIPVAEWGDPNTPFQLAGKLPVGRDPVDERLWDYAHDHLGFYGWLRVANVRIARKVGVGLMDLSDRLWRDAYDEQVHPGEAADVAVAEEAAELGIEP